MRLYTAPRGTSDADGGPLLALDGGLLLALAAGRRVDILQLDFSVYNE